MLIKSPKNRAALSLAASFIVILTTAKSLLTFFTGFGSGNMYITGAECFKYFTVDSNILAALCCSVLIPYTLKALTGSGEYILPRFALRLKLTGTAAVTVTMLTVIFFLGPVQGYGYMYIGDNLWLHLINPLICEVSFILLEAGEMKKRDALYGMLPTLVYGIIYLIMVVVIGESKGGWRDFYGFNAGGMWLVSFAAMLAANLIISYGLFALRRLCINRK